MSRTAQAIEAEPDPKGAPPEPVRLTPRFEQAMAYVVHGGQVRKGTTVPYFSHVLMVTAIALEYGATEDEAIGALLHDAVEDGGGKPRQADVHSRFGDAVAQIVAGCTDADVVPKSDWTTRKRNYIAHVRGRDQMFVHAPGIHTDNVAFSWTTAS